jgi:GntR family transcriptional repressor for pyruvate dehydrogenase complex
VNTPLTRIGEVGEVKGQRLYLQVAEQLRALISEGEFSAGQRLPSERDLAARFEVSRPTIREATIALEIAGAVEVRPGSGVYVTGQGAGSAALPDGQDPGPFEILEARKVIEGEICALAAARIGDEQLARLQALLDAMAAGEGGSDGDSGVDSNGEQAESADEAFHCLIAEASGNSALCATVTWLWRLRNESEISTHFHSRVRQEGSRPIVADHRRILAALRAGDAAGAREAMTAHLQRVIDQLLEVM